MAGIFDGDPEIVVTALRRNTNVQGTPAAVSALNAAELEDRGIVDVSGLQFLVPGLDVGTLGVGGTNITIRGVGLNQGSPGVAVHVDGVYQTVSSMATLAQVDLERVEILRGPQGTLYGRNANGGVINFITAKPTDRFEGEMLASYQSYDQSRLMGKVNLPISDNIKSRFVVDYANRGKGFVRNVAGGEDLDAFERISGRGAVTIALPGVGKLELTASGAHETGPTSYLQIASLPSAKALAAYPFLRRATISLKPRTTTANDPSTSERDFYQFTGTGTSELGFATFKSITSYTYYTGDQQTDSDGSDISAFLQMQHHKSRAVTQEISLSSAGEVFDWVLGAYYLKDNAEHTLFFSFPLGSPPLPPGSYLDNSATKTNTEVLATFADTTFHVANSIDLIAGARYSKENQFDRYSTEAGLLLATVRRPLFSFCDLREDRQSFESFTPRGGLQFRATDNQSFYATVSKGFKAGGTNLNACGNNQFSPEEIVSYEAGYRSAWLGNTLKLNLTGFHYDYTDLQLNQVTELVNRVTNAAAARVWGIELESGWTPNRNLSIGGNISWLDAKYASFESIDTLNPSAGVQNLKGMRLNNAPQWSTNLSVALSSGPTSAGRFTMRTDFSYRSKVYFREFNSALDKQGAYGMLNASLVWDAPGTGFTARLFGTNLTNVAYIGQGGSAGNLGTMAIAYGAPRQIGIEGRYRF